MHRVVVRLKTPGCALAGLFHPLKMAYNSKSIQTSDLFNYYLTMNINNICRICLEKGAKLMPIFDPIKPPHFSILIMACASVQVIEGDGLPPFICQKCISKLNVAFQFKSQCESADTKLRQCYENLQQMPQPSDLSEITYEATENDAIEQETALHLAGDLDVMHENCENNRTEEPRLQALQNVVLEPGTSLHIDKIELTELKLEFNDLKAENLGLEVNGTSETDVKPKKTRDHQCDTCGKIFRTKPGLVHHIRIHTGERPYVCHLCDKRFINGGHLHTHMRTHTGEKNHLCAACDKAFATAQQLTKHTIAIHTSERPYGCTFCPKRFASSSNLNTHVKIHTGEKNYHCDQCGKAFSTKGQLYQHMLVHTGEKAFLCEFCNKRFSQKAHLVRHLKMHKN